LFGQIIDVRLEDGQSKLQKRISIEQLITKKLLSFSIAHVTILFLRRAPKLFVVFAWCIILHIVLLELMD
jgi:hypothetical protein